MNTHNIDRELVLVSALLRQRKSDARADEMMAEYLSHPRDTAQVLAQASGADEFNPARGAVAWLEGGRQIWYSLPKVKVTLRTRRVARIEMSYDVAGTPKA